eukprot:CAMPEP_0202711166 /NCGR_PEP_ID=MMETSP1385-20130828/23023_1 /ASSEMBLY_ACC=CAM_ASM_000861 /TAXON_ID=933848 /ORGANISM="Elphidium margaritaceum" /LENGTH=208 /DNA_ID=CAMNT_0049370841 /DNA_START=53 /DNA_END=676 /DNA_ORIENTATION=+
MLAVPLTPTPLHDHESIFPDIISIASGCRTVSYDPQRRLPVTGVQSNTRKMPTTTRKSTVARGDFHQTRRKRIFQSPLGVEKNISPEAFNPSPCKKRKTFHPRTLPATPIKQQLSPWCISSDSGSDFDDQHTYNSAQPSTSISAAAQKQRYFLNLGVVGTGSFSNVFKVRNFESQKLYALKQTNEKVSVSDALNEVKIVQLLQQEWRK